MLPTPGNSHSGTRPTNCARNGKGEKVMVEGGAGQIAANEST